MKTNKQNEQPARADLLDTCDSRLLSLEAEPAADGFTDYSEEAIPERDPEYRLPDGTLSETETVEYMPPAERLALARSLEELGMSRARASFVASL